MGNFLSAMKEALTGVLNSFSNTHAKIIMLGLDNAGKTTVLYKFKLDELVTTIPTIGFNVETVQPTNNVSFTMWDVGGQDKIRVLWKHYFNGSDGLIFVVDASDRSRFVEARNELNWILESDEMAGVPVVVFANKQDLPSAASPSEVADSLGLSKIRTRKWHVQGTNATIGDGLVEAMQELSGLVKDFQSNKKRVYS